MKFLVLMFCLIAHAGADVLKLDRYDQLKLAELLARIPAEAKIEKSEKEDETSGLQKRFFTFPKEEMGFQIFCETHYYNNSPYVSSAQCLFEIDPNHHLIEHNYDEYRISLKDKAMASGLYQSIPHGQPRREIRSWQRDRGTNFEGIRSEIFRYYLSCLSESCELRISEQGLRRN